MIDEQAKTLGLRAVRALEARRVCPWRDGMLVREGIGPGVRIHCVDADGLVFATVPGAGITCAYFSELPGKWPDFRDDGTLGCLLALVREAWGMPGIFVACIDEGRNNETGIWGARTSGLTYLPSARLMTDGANEIEALVATLEAAPRPEVTHG